MRDGSVPFFYWLLSFFGIYLQIKIRKIKLILLNTLTRSILLDRIMVEAIKNDTALIRINVNITPRPIDNMHLLMSANQSVIHVLCLNHIIEAHIVVYLQLVDLS